MKLRYYTEDDYCAGTPCIYKHGDSMQTVAPVEMSGRAPFDGSRKLTVRLSGGNLMTRSIGGSDLTQVFYAAA